MEFNLKDWVFVKLWQAAPDVPFSYAQTLNSAGTRSRYCQDALNAFGLPARKVASQRAAIILKYHTPCP
jgi:hypothetical protein